MTDDREVIGLDATRDGAWVRVNGEIQFEPWDPVAEGERIKRRVFEDQRRWALKNQRAAGRI